MIQKEVSKSDEKKYMKMSGWLIVRFINRVKTKNMEYKLIKVGRLVDNYSYTARTRNLKNCEIEWVAFLTKNLLNKIFKKVKSLTTSLTNQ